MVRKIVCLLIGCTLSFSLYACSGGSNPEGSSSDSNNTITNEAENETVDASKAEEVSKNQFSLKEVNKLGETAEYTFTDTNADKRIDPSAPKDFFTYYEAKTEGNVYLATTFEIKNIGGTAKVSDTFFDVSYEINGKEYNAFAVVEESDGSDFNYANITNIEPLETRNVVFLAEIPEGDINSDINLIINSDGKKLSNTFKIEDIKPEKQVVELGTTLSKEDYADITIDSLEYVEKLEPSAPTSYFRYYEVNDVNKTYLCLGLTVKNSKSSDLDAEHVLYVKATYNDKYKYDSFGVVEESNGADFRYGNMAPLETAKAYYLVEMPMEVKDGKVELEINFNGDKYYIQK